MISVIGYNLWYMTTGMFVTGNNVLGPTKDADQDDILPDIRKMFVFH